MYWKHLFAELSERDDIRIVEKAARGRYDRYLPLFGQRGVVHTSLFRWPFPARSCQLVMTAHDLAYERRYIDGHRASVGRLERRLAVQRASGIVCVSKATLHDLEDFYGAELADVPDDRCRAWTVGTVRHRARCRDRPRRTEPAPPSRRTSRLLQELRRDSICASVATRNWRARSRSLWSVLLQRSTSADIVDVSPGTVAAGRFRTNRASSILVEFPMSS